MASQKDVKNRIASIKNINKITRAMEMVAAARLRRAEQRIEQLRPYAQGMRKLTRRAAEQAGGIPRVPVLVERDLILYESNIINEYIDERFPHPQLMPADPVMRARARLMLFNMEAELFSQIEAIESGKEKQVEKARQQITDRLIELSPVFTRTKHMLGDDFTMLDVAIAPLLWRLDHYGVRLGKTAAPLMKYAERIFSRPAFIEALTPSEKVMRK